MARTMKAAIVREFGKPLFIEQVPVPTPGEGQILIKIAASGVCHTDVHAADGDWPVKPKLPLIPGHEGVGRVAALGKGVTSVKEGDRVGIALLHTSCGYCEYCISGWETLCMNQKNSGYSVDGAYAEYALADAKYVGHLPANVPFAEIAPIVCAGVTTYKGMRKKFDRANLPPGNFRQAKPGPLTIVAAFTTDRFVKSLYSHKMHIRHKEKS